jgi:PKD repeat protein
MVLLESLLGNSSIEFGNRREEKNMKNKILGLFVCMLLLLSIMSIQTSGKTIDDKKSTYPKSMTQNFLWYPYMKNLPKLDPNEASPKPPIGDPPKEFSWRDYQGRDWTTPAKDQGKIGTCPVFAALAALESVINIRDENAELDVDLSEQYVISCLPSAGSAISGGVAFQVFKYIMDTSPEGNFYNGIIPESCFPYQGKDGVPCSDKCIDWVDHLIPIHGYGFWIPNGSPEDRQRIKTQILEKGPVVAGIFATRLFMLWGIFFHNPSYVYSTLKETSGTNHAVLLVGWKDDPNVMNGGYWIAKNSWGTQWGYDGFFNIAYGCLGIDNDSITWVEYDSASIDSPPVADAGGPYSGSIGQNILFNGSRSFDSEGKIVSYDWDFGDGMHGAGEMTTHSYSKSGVYVVNLTATDESGYQDSDEITALIDFWQIGESWKFNVSYYFDFTIIKIIPRFLTFSSNDIVFKVVGETDENYLVEYSGTASGFAKFYLFKKPVKAITITGDILFRKKDLGIKHYNMTYDGIMGLFQIPVTLMMTTEFNPQWQIFPFPFDTGSVSYFTFSNITHNVTMKIGTIKATQYSFFYPHGPLGCTCEEKVITVPAGTFTTVHIKNESDPSKIFQFEYYYSPDVRNIVKSSIHYNKSIIIFDKYVHTRQTYFGMDLELVSHTC